MSNPVSKVEEVAAKLLSGILSNPNYNFNDAKKVAGIAIDHAEALVNKLAVITEKVADKVEKVAETVKAEATKVKDKTAKKEDPLAK